MSMHATISTVIKDRVVLDRACAAKKYGAVTDVNNQYVAGRTVSGWCVKMGEGGGQYGPSVVITADGEAHFDSDYRSKFCSLVDQYSIEMIRYQAEQMGHSCIEGVNAQGEQYISVQM